MNNLCKSVKSAESACHVVVRTINSGYVMAENILTRILAHKKIEVRERKAQLPPSELEVLLALQSPARSLTAALHRAPGMGVIAEIKKASPSAGLIRPDFHPETVADQYRAGGADALSVITDRHFFQGALEFIPRIRHLVDIPLLRKEFVVDTYQILEARAFGADALLLIVAALAPETLGEMLAYIRELGMEALVEVHDEAELAIALAQGANLVGVNNRDLISFRVDLAVTERLARLVPPEVTLVAESGISTAVDVWRMQQAGAKAMLVGTHLMRRPDPGVALAELKSYIQKN